ncbi:putative Phosphatidylinositol 3-and 4-kinase [Operophtera brumata]|uniref:Putative Phosphatidylinositol 3-and 4-kinase n=1 Tax=Operophtera brumata TaxID=104452 RepID=A0A0L7LBE4_OPEBR|nr:putative Phosphatidylinositol 3-and 4-kinase [Operophtera brumata]
MHAFIALTLALAAPALAASRDRLGYEREIDSTMYNQVPKLLDYVLSDEYLASQKNRGKLVTKPRQDEPLAVDNVILQSNTVRIVQSPAKRDVESQPTALVRRRRGYNLENVRVPARYPYLPVANFNRFRRWG